MEIQLFAGSIKLGIVDSKIIDDSMGIVGGILQPSPAYFSDFQSFFRANTQAPDWQALADLELTGLFSLGEILECDGGICLTDVEEYSEISVEFCGLNQRIMSIIR
ncbi:hypothetical protein GCM10028824_08040 [Hymenobacter segetis]|uniref:T6SS immunity protein Tdi1 C-terminal domain-containing protein n=1 Tax=Hymenobacter segetis TaxID=2025509 RepID=A0ABU9LSH3_9BACT